LPSKRLTLGRLNQKFLHEFPAEFSDPAVEAAVDRPAIIPQDLDWASLLRLDGDPLERQYRHILTELGKRKGTLGVIFRKAQNKIQDPAKLRRLMAAAVVLNARIESERRLGFSQRKKFYAFKQ
jgi:hypothetical protein